MLAGSADDAATVAVQRTGRTTGLPLPRFVSLASDRVNLRVGPKRTHDVVAVYRRRGLPLMVLDEFDTWRRVQDHEGDTGWVHTGLLSGRKTVMLTDAAQALLRAPGDDAAALAMVEPGVIADLVRCDGGWCFVEIASRRGWLRRDGLWGVMP